MIEHIRLDPEQLRRLLDEARGTFVILERNGTRPGTVGMLTVEDEEIAVSRDSAVTVRPDKLPEGAEHLMLNLLPLHIGNTNIGWLVKLPALNITVGRNFIKVVRGKVTVSDRRQPDVSVQLRNLVIMEQPDVMTLVLSTRTRDMRT